MSVGGTGVTTSTAATTGPGSNAATTSMGTVTAVTGIGRHTAFAATIGTAAAARRPRTPRHSTTP